MAYFGPTIVPHATYQEFRNAVLGNGYNMDGAYGCQCWDGADLIWYQYGLRLYTGPQGYAVECWTVSRSLNAVYPFTDMYTGLQGIKRGDIVVFAATSSNPAGHIAYADEDYNGGPTLNCLGQNQGPGAGEWGTVFNIWANNVSEIIGAFRNTNWIVVPPTPTRKKSGFPWVLFARKFRSGMR